MEGPNRNRPHGPDDNLITPAEGGFVDASPTFGSNIRQPSIIPSGRYMPSVASMNIIPEPPFSSSLPSNLPNPSTSFTPSIALSSLSPNSLASFLSGTFVEVAGPCFSNPRSGQHAVYSLTTGNINCFRDHTSPFHWFGFRNGDLQVEYFDWNLQFPNNLSRAYVRDILALHKTLANALYINYSGRHTKRSVNTILSRIQPLVDRHLYSNTMAHSPVHILFDFPFLECHKVYGREVQVKVVITVEFYQAPWRSGAKRWNRRGSLNVINIACHMTNNPEDLYTFLEVVALDPMPDSRIVQSLVTPTASSNALPPVLVTAASMNPGSLMAQNARSLVTLPSVPKSTSHGSQAVSNPVPGLDLVSDMLMTVETTPCSNNAGVDLSPPTSSGTKTFSEPDLFTNQGRFSPPNPQDLMDALSGYSTSSSFQKDIQPSPTNNGSSAADTSATLLQTPGTADHQIVDNPASSFEVIDDNGESLFMVVSNPQDDGASVVDLDADQPATASTNPARRFPCTYCTKPPFTTKWNLQAHLNTHIGVKFPCRVCSKVYRRQGDLHRHIQIRHKGYFWRCDHCLKVHVRRPTLGQLFRCKRNKGGFHVFKKHDSSSASASVPAAVKGT